jgi:plasmid maintenance system antidote protein VapI
MTKKIHIGKLIRQKFDESGMTKTAFAEKLGCERNNIYNIFEKQSINIDLLYSISCVLHYDFFQLYSNEIKTETVLKLGA